MNHYFAQNLKYIREKKELSQSGLARRTVSVCEEYNKTATGEKAKPITQASIARWEAGENSPSIDNIVILARALNVDLPELIGKNLKIDNAEYINATFGTIKIPVLGFIKAGTPIEAQEEIVDYIDIPKEWVVAGKRFYALKINGNSMFPKYLDSDIVIFEQTNDYVRANNCDCAVMVNGNDATFKKVFLTETELILQPYNNEYKPMIYSDNEVQELPIKIIGIAIEKRSKI